MTSIHLFLCGVQLSKNLLGLLSEGNSLLNVMLRDLHAFWFIAADRYFNKSPQEKKKSGGLDWGSWRSNTTPDNLTTEGVAQERCNFSVRALAPYFWQQQSRSFLINWATI
jgi:hypothetical protein